MKFSIVVITYNSSFEKIRKTLDSVLVQTFKDYEIIIADDGSAENNEQIIKKYFKDKEFTNYKLVMNKENQGTVMNLLSGIKVSDGEYIRDFGPGDMFYSKDTLKKLDMFLSKRECSICFGLMRGFKEDNGKVIDAPFYHPFDIQAYRKKRSEDRIIRNLVLYGDNPSGASVCIKRGVFEKYLKEISDYVKYEEDLILPLASLEGERIRLFDRYMILYENGSGVSTGKNSRFAELLRQDVDRFYDELFRRYPDNKYVKKRKKVKPFFKIKNVYIRSLLRTIVNPGAVAYIFISYIERLSKCHKDHNPEESIIGFENE